LFYLNTDGITCVAGADCTVGYYPDVS